MKSNSQMLASLPNKYWEFWGHRLKLNVFSLVGMLMALKHCRLLVDNLDQIISVMINCSQHKDLTSFLKVESSLVEDNYDLMEESNYFEQLELDKD